MIQLSDRIESCHTFEEFNTLLSSLSIKANLVTPHFKHPDCKGSVTIDHLFQRAVSLLTFDSRSEREIEAADQRLKELSAIGPQGGVYGRLVFTGSGESMRRVWFDKKSTI